MPLRWVFDFAFPIWPWIFAGILVAWALIAPGSLDPIYKGWMRFGLFMSKITTPIILGIVFFGVIMPMGLFIRVFRNDPMKRQFDNELDSYKTLSRRADIKHLERPY